MPAPSPMTGTRRFLIRPTNSSEAPGPYNEPYLSTTALHRRGRRDHPLQVADRGERLAAAPRAGSGSSGSSSVFTGRAVRAFGQPV